MKRAHRTIHLLTWFILGPAIVAVLLLAVLHRPGDAVNEALPEALIMETR